MSDAFIPYVLIVKLYSTKVLVANLGDRIKITAFSTIFTDVDGNKKRTHKFADKSD